ncbi:MAG: hypothetical protein ABI583_09890 [Betaproteobacteria bacterium]
MLSSQFRRVPSPRFRRSQEGVVLFMALIMLVAMTLAGVALVRSVDTSNLIAGNLAFKQSATSEGEIGLETGIGWVLAGPSTKLTATDTNNGYFAVRGDPSGQTWAEYFETLESNSQVVSLPLDTSTGNQVSYVIHRLCNQAGLSTVPGALCSVPQSAGSSEGSSKGGGTVGLQRSSEVYYRVTAKIVGPRNTVSFVQSVIAL